VPEVVWVTIADLLEQFQRAIDGGDVDAAGRLLDLDANSSGVA